MRFTRDRLARLQQNLEPALTWEWSQVSAAQNGVARFRLRGMSRRPADSRPMSIRATVVADDVKNSLSRELVHLQVVHVTASLGETYREGFVLLSRWKMAALLPS